MTPEAGPGRSALALLSLCELFADLDEHQMEAMATEVSLVRLERGETLFRQGDAADCLYAVVSGRLQAFYEKKDGQRELLAELRAGETVGELDLIDGKPRVTSVLAVRDSELVKVTAAGFDRIIRSDAVSLNKVATILAGRVRNLTCRPSPAPSVRTITVMPAGEGCAAGRFTARLAESLGSLGSVLHLNLARFETLFRRSFESGDAVGAWFNELEQAYRFVVLETDDTASPWTLHCVRQADRIVSIGEASSTPVLSIAEQVAIGLEQDGKMAPLELVLLHDNNGLVFSGTSKWLANRPVHRHHHVRAHVPGDISRVARLLAGKALGLALGGGGARGFAHIGVLRAIEEAGIPIDMIGGVSMGATLAGLYAMGRSWKELIEVTRDHLAGKVTSDFTLPVIALSSGRRLRRAHQAFFGTTAIEDLWLNYFCTSCDLSTSELVVHRKGPLWSAVHASNAIPVLLPPVISAGHILIDGGVLNNQPGDILKQLCGGEVIVSRVSPRRDMTVDTCLTEMPSAWRVLRSRLNPFERTIRVPGIPFTMLRTLMVASDQKSREVERTADFFLSPPIDAFRLEDFRRGEEIAEVGYQYTCAEIAKWKDQGRL